MPDLRPEELAIVRRILATHLPGREVKVFGSRATGQIKAHSDLDLVVMGEALDDVAHSALIDAFEQSDLPYRVDLVYWNSVPDALRTRITRQARPLSY
jgi:type I restriction enzyme S subunit